MTNKNIIKVGTKVTWSGSWNTDPEQEVIVESISKREFEGDKEGTPIDEIPFEERIIVSLTLTTLIGAMATRYMVL